MSGRHHISADVLSGKTSDVYFLRTQQVLRAESLDPVMTMEAFPNTGGVLCGILEVLALMARALPGDAEVLALQRGSRWRRRKSPCASAARTRRSACTKTPCRACLRTPAAGLEHAAVVGGCVGCSTPPGAALAGVQPSGMMPHAMVQVIAGKPVAKRGRIPGVTPNAPTAHRSY
jgi:nicotinate phosphoribosyltransferase